MFVGLVLSSTDLFPATLCIAEPNVAADGLELPQFELPPKTSDQTRATFVALSFMRVCNSLVVFVDDFKTLHLMSP